MHRSEELKHVQMYWKNKKVKCMEIYCYSIFCQCSLMVDLLNLNNCFLCLSNTLLFLWIV